MATYRTKTDIFGRLVHYDEKGRKVGYSKKRLWSNTYDHYDAKGNKTGESRRAFPGMDIYNTYDKKGRKVGRMERGWFGIRHYDEKGRRIGTSRGSMFGTKTELKDDKGRGGWFRW